MSTRRSTSSGPTVPNPETLILPNGPVGEQATELLEEFVHSSQHEEEIDVDADYHLRRAHHKNLAWYRTPSPWCVLKPEIFPRTSGGHLTFGISPTLPPMTPTVRNHSVGVEVSRGSVYNTLLYSSTEGGSCAADPVVQAEVAKLAAGEITSRSVSMRRNIAGLPTYFHVEDLASRYVFGYVKLTWRCSLHHIDGYFELYNGRLVGFYRHGRTRLLSISVIGLLFTDLNFIFTAKNFQYLPGGYWFVIIGPIVEGFLGGGCNVLRLCERQLTSSSGVTAAIAAIHAYVADTTTESARSRTLSLALGLLFTGMAIGPSLGGLLVRFTGSPLSVFYAAAGIHLIYAFIVCLVLPESLLKSQMEQSRLKHDSELRDTSENLAAGALVRIRRLFAFLSPLSVFLPDFKEMAPGQNPLKRKKKDWNLTIVAGVYALAISIMVGPSGGPEAEPLLPGSSREAVTKVPHSAAFDLRLAHVSLLIEVVSYTLMALAPTALAFTGFSITASMGAGLSPALQSVALALYRRRGGTESGRLFGALGVLQALSSQIISPAMYGLVYTKTVATFPRAIFILSMTSITCSFALLTFVRLPRKDVRVSSDVEGEGVPTVSAQS
ncbi:hypothetical protein C0995_002616 [Termitomyces sp. Mi166|nr:hypothetical protein C0995_002616 [Termitomyces sp. Mi166\